VRRGVSAAELALILPVLVTLVMGGVDFGRFAYNYIAVQNAARAGAAYGTMNSYVASGQTAWETGVQSAARDEMNQQTGYTSTNLTVQATTTIESNGLRRVQVDASYPFQTVVAWPGFPSTVTLRSVVQMRAVR
jgi:Flp pilus assembly protein TadG